MDRAIDDLRAGQDVTPEALRARLDMIAAVNTLRGIDRLLEDEQFLTVERVAAQRLRFDIARYKIDKVLPDAKAADRAPAGGGVSFNLHMGPS